jgi:hypothetical protein
MQSDDKIMGNDKAWWLVALIPTRRVSEGQTQRQTIPRLRVGL